MKLRERLDALGEQLSRTLHVLDTVTTEQGNLAMPMSVRRELGHVSKDLEELGYRYRPPRQYALDKLIKLKARDAAQSADTFDVAALTNAVQADIHNHGPAFQTVLRASGATYIEEAVAWDFLTEQVELYLFGPRFRE